ncbi:helix-turn-helix domain-containing protein [Streptomyces sudanensis]|uniref:helix-turn-helix domain-containing protein n=1 Tax=Streptomyces sudanensis TaxID=436397 RepID=UPI0020CC9A4B|nr:helix-turn-helix transcriptional regulator [Streptomyces sudanensis]MCQ0003187.1 helix-turn-helix domain-containing protein [Streptomyces sudanensis]
MPVPPERNAGATSFAELLKDHRDRSGLTQQQLADFATLSVRAIRDLESGRVRRPRRESVELLADALRLSGPERLRLHAAGEARWTTGFRRSRCPLRPLRPARWWAGKRSFRCCSTRSPCTATAW